MEWVVLVGSKLFSATTPMGRLVLAHHKSYHPYKAENIERVRKDEEEARIREAKEEGRLKLAVSACNVFPNAYLTSFL